MARCIMLCKYFTLWNEILSKDSINRQQPIGISNKYQQKRSWERGNSLVASHPKVAKDNANGSGNVH